MVGDMNAWGGMHGGRGACMAMGMHGMGDMHV